MRFPSERIPSFHIAITDAALAISRDRRFRLRIGRDLELQIQHINGHRGGATVTARATVTCPHDWGKDSLLELELTMDRATRQWLVWGNAKMSFGKTPEIVPPLQGKTFRFFIAPDLGERSPDAPYRPFRYRIRNLTRHRTQAA